MMYSAFSRSLVLLALIALGSVNALAQRAAGSFERTLAVSEPLRLDVRTGSGDITVRGGASGRAIVRGRIAVHGRWWRNGADADEIVRALESDPPVELDGSLLRVGHLDDRRFDNVAISYEIEVPEDTGLEIDTGSGSQNVSGIAGGIEADAGSGTIRLSDISGPVNAGTGSGSIRAERISGAFEGRTGSGSIRLVQSAPGEVIVSTGSGSAELVGIAGPLRARAGSGRVSIEGAVSGDWNVDAGSGSVLLRLPDDAAFELDAETGSGEIGIDHPLTAQGRIANDRVTGTVRGGGPVLRLRTGSGDIRVE